MRIKGSVMTMNNDLLRYSTPPSEWKEGLLLGNGRLGVTLCGQPRRERLALNHEWLYTGMFRDRALIPPPENALAEVRAEIEAGRFEEATKLANEFFAPTGGLRAKTRRQRVDPYQPAGDLWLADCGEGEITAYERSLSLSGACAEIRYARGGAVYVKKVFCQYPLGLVFAELSCEGGELDYEIALSRVDDPNCFVSVAAVCGGAEGRLTLSGRFCTGMTFSVCAALYADGEMTAQNGSLRLRGGRSALLVLNIGTAALGDDPLAEAALPPQKPDFAAAFAAHKKAFGALYDRVSLSVGGEAPQADTAQRLAAFRAGSDPSLPVLYFNFARYLLISSAGSLPPQLQGIWNERLDPPWDSDFHLDINLQMNYWISQTAALSETEQPLFAYLERLLPSAREAAKALYNCRGVLYPIQTDAWSIATPEAHGWAVTTSCAPWLALHYWEHYAFTLDERFLKERAYPFLKECAAFYEDYLYEGSDGTLTIAPSQSPENRLKGFGDLPVTIVKNATFDVELCTLIFQLCIRSAGILGTDAEQAERWRRLLEKLPPFQIGSKGQLLEFDREYEEAEPGHRHVSHLFGVYPAALFTAKNRPELFAAAKRSLEIRLSHGGGHTGWSRAWTACLFARFGDAEKAFEHLTALICDFATVSLLDLHPPRIFQIDGNFGGAAAVCEMLVQSDGETVTLLPACPAAWASGHAKGLRARGGFTLDFAWEQGRVTELSVSGQGVCSVSADTPLSPALAARRDADGLLRLRADAV